MIRRDGAQVQTGQVTYAVREYLAGRLWRSMRATSWASEITGILADGTEVEQTDARSDPKDHAG